MRIIKTKIAVEFTIDELIGVYKIIGKMTHSLMQSKYGLSKDQVESVSELYNLLTPIIGELVE